MVKAEILKIECFRILRIGSNIFYALRSYVRKTVFMRSSDQRAANGCKNLNCLLGLRFGEELGLWSSSGHLLLPGDRLGLEFLVMV